VTTVIRPNTNARRHGFCGCSMNWLAVPPAEAFGGGYDRRVYNKGAKDILGKHLPILCGKLAKTDVSKYSLEMQIWWRDHQRIDAARVAEEQRAAKVQAEKNGPKETHASRKAVVRHCLVNYRRCSEVRQPIQRGHG